MCISWIKKELNDYFKFVCSRVSKFYGAPSLHLLGHTVHTRRLEALPLCTVARVHFNGHFYRPITKEAEEWVNTFSWCDLQI